MLIIIKEIIIKNSNKLPFNNDWMRPKLLAEEISIERAGRGSLSRVLQVAL